MITTPNDIPSYELVLLKERVDELFKTRMHSLIRPGKVAKFFGRDGNEELMILIDKVNIKTVSGNVCDSFGNILMPKRGWRVGHSQLTPVIAAPTIADKLPPPRVEADKPAASVFSPTDSW